MSEYFKRLFSNRLIRRFGIPAIVVVITVILLVTLPWTSGEPADEIDETPAVVITAPASTPAPEDEPGPSQAPDSVIVATPLPVPEMSGYYNPLTGEWMKEDISKIRPFGISTNNSPAALPHWGISKADIVIEFAVEGWTRLLMLYTDVSDAGMLGSIRSFRTSSQQIMEAFDAIFVHWGGLAYNEAELVNGIYGPVTRYWTIDAPSNSRIGSRASGTGRALEHTGYTTGERLLNDLPEVVPDFFRFEHEDFYKQSLQFKQDATPADGQNADNITVRFYENSKTTNFKYNEDDKVYYATQSGRDIIDGNNNVKPGYANVIIVQTELRLGINVHGHVFVRTTGEGNGYFANGGKYTEISWLRDEGQTPFFFYNKDGTPLELGIGKSFICFVSDSATQVFE